MKMNQFVKNILKVLWRVVVIVLCFRIAVFCFDFQFSMPAVTVLVDLVGVIAFICSTALFVNLIMIVSAFISSDREKQKLMTAGVLILLGVAAICDKGYAVGLLSIIIGMLFFLNACADIHLHQNYPDQG